MQSDSQEFPLMSSVRHDETAFERLSSELARFTRRLAGFGLGASRDRLFEPRVRRPEPGAGPGN